MIWFTSDWHDLHEKVIGFCDRPFSNVYSMRSVLVEKYNRYVKSADTVFFVGDMFFGTYEDSKELMTQLPGRKILIQGNHDRFSQKQYLSLGFYAVYEEVLIRLFGERIRISHYPHRPSLWSQLFKKNARELRYLERRPPRDGRWLIHGHTHSAEQVRPQWKEIHVGVDAWDYYPVSQRTIESLIGRYR